MHNEASGRSDCFRLRTARNRYFLFFIYLRRSRRAEAEAEQQQPQTQETDCEFRSRFGLGSYGIRIRAEGIDKKEGNILHTSRRAVVVHRSYLCNNSGTGSVGSIALGAT